MTSLSYFYTCSSITQFWSKKVNRSCFTLLNLKYSDISNKNAFQSKAHLPLADRKPNTCNLTLEWPWPWCNLNLIDDLDLRQVKLMSRCQISIFHEMTLTLTQWPWPNLWPWPQTSQTELNWCPGSQISIFHEMTLTQWPWYSNMT